MEQPVLLKVSGLTKSFGAVQALRGAEFELRAGEIHALAGENGAGKSTLMNIVDGILKPDSGEIRLDGKPVVIPSPRAAQDMGIGFVHQEIALCPDISVSENIFMSVTNSSKSRLMNYRDLDRRAAKIIARLGDIDPTTLVGELSISQQQLVEIAKALTLDCRILIFDEPTAALTERESDRLFEIIHSLAADGIGIIYISHRMAEIFEHCDRVTVMRDGRYIRTLAIAETSPEEVVASMVGRVLDSLYPDKLREDQRSSEAVLEVEGLSEARDFKDVSFRLMKAALSAPGAARSSRGSAGWRARSPARCA